MTGRRLFLLASLLLNLFLAAALVAGVAWVRGRVPTIGAGTLRVPGAELAQDDRQRLRRAIREARRSVGEVIAEGRAARRAAALALRGPMPDRTAASAALARAREADTRVRAAVEARMLAVVLTLSSDERARVADAVARRAETRGGRRRP